MTLQLTLGFFHRALCNLLRCGFVFENIDVKNVFVFIILLQKSVSVTFFKFRERFLFPSLPKKL